MNTNQLLTVFIATALAMSAISAVGLQIRPAAAQAVTITTSADNHGGTFYGESYLQVVINDPSADDDDTIETVSVSVQVTPQTGSGETEDFDVFETSASSGRFEFYLVHEDTDIDESVLDPINTDDIFGDGAGTAPDTGAIVVGFGPDEAALNAGVAISDFVDAEVTMGDEDADIDIEVGDLEITVNYEEDDGLLELDRESYGSTSIVHAFITDQDSNNDPTNVDTFFVAQAALDGDSAGELFDLQGATFDSIDNGATDPAAGVLFTETGDNTARFEAELTLSSAGAGATADEIVFGTTESITLILFDKADYDDVAEADGDVVDDSTDTSTLSFDIDDVDGEMDEISDLTFGSELKVTVRDNDRNVNSESEDDIAGALNVQVGVGDVDADGNYDVGDSDEETVPLTETDDNTGVFEIDLSNSELRIEILTDGQDPDPQNGILELRIADLDRNGDGDCADIATGDIDDDADTTCDPINDFTEDIVITYTDPADDDSNAGGVTSSITTEMALTAGTVGLPDSAGVNDDFTFTLTDADLNNNPRSRDSYTFQLTPREDVIGNADADCTDGAGVGDDDNNANGACDFGPDEVIPLERSGVELATVGTLEFEIEGDAAAFAVTTTYTLVETGANTGIFTAELDMDEIITSSGEDVEDGDVVEITYNDLMDDTTRENSDRITIGKASTGVDFSRTAVPIPPQTTDDAAGILGTTVVTTMVVTDPDQNDQSNAEDTLSAAGANTIDFDGDTALFPVFTIEVEAGNGDTSSIDTLAEYDTAGGCDDFAGVCLQDIMPNLPTLTETGKSTGVFDDELEFVDTAAITLAEWQDLEITFNYITAADETESAGFTFRGNDGVVTTDQTGVRNGVTVVITVQDEDLNLDDNEVEEFSSTVGTAGAFILAVETEDDDLAGETTETFRETGDDTGIFTASFVVGTDIPVSVQNGDEVDQATNILVTYNDEIDSSGGNGDETEINLPVVSSTGTIQVTPELVGPGTEISVLIIDADLNEDPAGTNNWDPPAAALGSDDFFVSFRSDRDEVGEGSPEIEETGPNTGIFQFNLQLETDEAACANDDLPDTNQFNAQDGTTDSSIGACPGDLISIRYEDESDANGRSTTVSSIIEVRSWDPEFVADKDNYAVGDRVTISISDPDANRDADIADTLTDVRVFSTSDAVGEELSAIETGKDTGVFRLSFTVSSGTESGAITVKQGDTVSVEYTDDFPADFEDEEEDKEFLFTINVAGRTGVETTTPSAPALKDVTGRELSSIAVGQQAVLSTTIVNNNDESRPFVALVEVRDSDGITVFLAWQTGTLNPSGQTEVGLSWTPEDSGDYQVRTFVISDLANPQVLSSVQTSEVTVSG